VLPGLTHIATVLTPLAAAGIVVMFLSAIALHVRRGETRVIGLVAVVVTLALVVIWGRLGPYPLN
jgi:predicted PurR-regulated permease PerM